MPPTEEKEERSLPEARSRRTSRSSPSHNSDSPSSSRSRPSTSSESSSTSMSPEVSALFRMLGEHSIHVPEIDDPGFLIGRLPGYQRIIIPREQTLHDILRQSSGQNDVTHLRKVRLRVLASSVSLSRIGCYCPKIKTLILDGSGLSSLREIGISLKHLKILHVARCGLTSLDGTYGLTSLRELYAADNQIDNVGPCAALQNLKVINLDRNSIRCKRNTCLLSFCPNLISLSLIDTPLSKENDYQDYLLGILPSLQQLDGRSLQNPETVEQSVGIDNEDSESLSCSIEVSSMTEPNSDDYQKTPEDEENSKASKEFDTSSAMVSHEMTEEIDPSTSNSRRPATATGLPVRIRTPIENTSVYRRPCTAQPRSSIVFQHSEAVFLDSESEVTPSLLTSGEIVCGSIGRALSRTRSMNRGLRTPDTSVTKYSSDNSNVKFESEEVIIKDNDDERNKHLRTLQNIKTLLDQPLPEKPIESTPVVDLEFGVTGVSGEQGPWETNNIVSVSTNDALKATTMWRKAFKLYRKQRKIPVKQTTDRK